jgi:hypothetical protein
MTNDFLPTSFNSEPETEQQDRVVWSTAEVERIIAALDEGYKVKGTPFYEGNMSYKRANIVFEYTDEEMEHIKRCASDILYFAEHFATVMTDEGLQRIKLRDYQKGMLVSFVENRFNVCLASRQIGKCLAHDTDIYIRKEGREYMIKMYELWYLMVKNAELPFANRLINRIKYHLYRAHSRLNKIYESKRSKNI